MSLRVSWKRSSSFFSFAIGCLSLIHDHGRDRGYADLRQSSSRAVVPLQPARGTILPARSFLGHRIGGRSLQKLFAKAANAVAHAAGHPVTFVLCCLIVVTWAATGPLAGYSDTWQLIINTGTTIITFLMVFLIQNTQNRDGGAIQAKLDELLRASEGQNAFIGIEHLPEEEVEEFRRKCEAAVAALEREEQKRRAGHKEKRPTKRAKSRKAA